VHATDTLDQAIGEFGNATSVSRQRLPGLLGVLNDESSRLKNFFDNCRDLCAARRIEFFVLRECKTWSHALQASWEPAAAAPSGR